MVSIRFRYVVEDRDERGNVRLYLRLPGRAKVRLREVPGTDALLVEYQAAVAGFAPRPTAARRREAEAGTLLWLCTAYAAMGESALSTPARSGCGGAASNCAAPSRSRRGRPR